MKSSFYKWQKILITVCAAGFLCSLAFFVPFVQNLILDFGESLIHRPLTRYMWIKHFIEWGRIFLVFFALIPLAFCSKINFACTGATAAGEKLPELFFLISAILVLLLCSSCSPLYGFNPWVDSNCFFTVGKSVWSGKVIYRDLYEQKGPLLYFIHSVSYLLSKDTFLGVWFFEVAAAFILLHFSYKTLCLFARPSAGLFLPPVLAVIFSSRSFVWGDSAEEFCLCLLSYPLFVSLKNLKEEKEFSSKEVFVSGICAGCVLWVKFSLVGFFIGWAVVPIWSYAKTKNFIGITKSAALIFCGVLAATLPHLIYFGVNRSISDWFRVYFLDNIFMYSRHSRLPVLVRPFYFCVKNIFFAYAENPLVFTLMIFSAAAIFRMSVLKRIKIHILLCFAFSLFLAYCGGVAHAYYSLILSHFAIFSAVFFSSVSFSQKIKGALSSKFLRMPVSAAVSLMIVVGFSRNIKYVGMKKTDFPQYKFAKIINKKENATLLNYGFLDGGFYTAAKIVPTCKYFCKLNLQNPMMMREQQRFVDEGLVDFVVTRNGPGDIEFDSENYALVLLEDDFESYEQSGKFKYSLYKKIEDVSP